jgi:hypothetical protein
MLPLNDNLKKRLLTIIVGAPIVIGILYIGGALFNVSLFIVMFIAETNRIKSVFLIQHMNLFTLLFVMSKTDKINYNTFIAC